MTKETIAARRASLIKGAQELNEKLEQLKVALEIQKGALSECDYWAKELEVSSEVEKETSEEINE